MLQVHEAGNVVVVSQDGMKMFDIEFSYAVYKANRVTAMRLIDEMVAAHNAETLNAKANKTLSRRIMEF